MSASAQAQDEGGLHQSEGKEKENRAIVSTQTFESMEFNKRLAVLNQ